MHADGTGYHAHTLIEHTCPGLIRDGPPGPDEPPPVLPAPDSDPIPF